MKSSLASFLILRLLGTTQQTRPPGSDETGLLALGGVAGDGRGLADMLMVTLEGLSASILDNRHVTASVVPVPESLTPP